MNFAWLISGGGHNLKILCEPTRTIINSWHQSNDQNVTSSEGNTVEPTVIVTCMGLIERPREAGMALLVYNTNPLCTQLTKSCSVHMHKSDSEVELILRGAQHYPSRTSPGCPSVTLSLADI